MTVINHNDLVSLSSLVIYPYPYPVQCAFVVQSMDATLYIISSTLDKSNL